MTPTWNGAKQPSLPPKRFADYLQMSWRALFALVTLTVLFLVFLFARAFDVIFSRFAGRPVSRFGTKTVRLWARITLPLIGLRLRVIGSPISVPGAYVGNHASWIDIIALQAAVAPFLVSKADVRGWPVIGTIGAAIGTLFIERNPMAVRGQGDALRGRLLQGDRLALFPEGTSSDGLRVLPFRSSLFEVFVAPELRGKIEVQPVVIQYQTRNDLPDSFYAWWGGASFGTHVCDVLARSSDGLVILSFLEPLSLNELRDRKEAARVAERMVRTEFERLNPDAR